MKQQPAAVSGPEMTKKRYQSEESQTAPGQVQRKRKKIPDKAESSMRKKRRKGQVASEDEGAKETADRKKERKRDKKVKEKKKKKKSLEAAEGPDAALANRSGDQHDGDVEGGGAAVPGRIDITLSPAADGGRRVPKEEGAMEAAGRKNERKRDKKKKKSLEAVEGRSAPPEIRSEDRHDGDTEGGGAAVPGLTDMTLSPAADGGWPIPEDEGVTEAAGSKKRKRDKRKSLEAVEGSYAPQKTTSGDRHNCDAEGGGAAVPGRTDITVSPAADGGRPDPEDEGAIEDAGRKKERRRDKKKNKSLEAAEGPDAALANRSGDQHDGDTEGGGAAVPGRIDMTLSPAADGGRLVPEEEVTGRKKKKQRKSLEAVEGRSAPPETRSKDQYDINEGDGGAVPMRTDITLSHSADGLQPAPEEEGAMEASGSEKKKKKKSLEAVEGRSAPSETRSKDKHDSSEDGGWVAVPMRTDVTLSPATNGARLSPEEEAVKEAAGRKKERKSDKKKRKKSLKAAEGLGAPPENRSGDQSDGNAGGAGVEVSRRTDITLSPSADGGRPSLEEEGAMEATGLRKKHKHDKICKKKSSEAVKGLGASPVTKSKDQHDGGAECGLAARPRRKHTTLSRIAHDNRAGVSRSSGLYKAWVMVSPRSSAVSEAHGSQEDCPAVRVMLGSFLKKQDASRAGQQVAAALWGSSSATALGSGPGTLPLTLEEQWKYLESHGFLSAWRRHDHGRTYSALKQKDRTASAAEVPALGFGVRLGRRGQEALHKPPNFQARIWADRRQVHIGSFETLEEAQRAHDRAYLALHGSSKAVHGIQLNFPAGELGNTEADEGAMPPPGLERLQMVIKQIRAAQRAAARERTAAGLDGGRPSLAAESTGALVDATPAPGLMLALKAAAGTGVGSWRRERAVQRRLKDEERLDRALMAPAKCGISVGTGAHAIPSVAPDPELQALSLLGQCAASHGGTVPLETLGAQAESRFLCIPRLGATCSICRLPHLVTNCPLVRTLVSQPSLPNPEAPSRRGYEQLGHTRGGTSGGCVAPGGRCLEMDQGEPEDTTPRPGHRALLAPSAAQYRELARVGGESTGSAINQGGSHEGNLSHQATGGQLGDEPEPHSLPLQRILEEEGRTAKVMESLAKAAANLASAARPAVLRKSLACTLPPETLYAIAVVAEEASQLQALAKDAYLPDDATL